jgi:hypothetical protein
MNVRGVECGTPEEGARETREKLDHTLRAYGRLERNNGELRRHLAEARRLLQEYGACDPYTGQPYEEVVEFLDA